MISPLFVASFYALPSNRIASRGLCASRRAEGLTDKMSFQVTVMDSCTFSVQAFGLSFSCTVRRLRTCNADSSPVRSPKTVLLHSIDPVKGQR